MDLNAQNPGSGSSSGGGTSQAADIPGAAASTVHDVLERAESAIGEAAEKVRPVVSKMPQTAQAPLYEAVHAAADAAASLREGADDLVRREEALLASATRYIRANPRQALGIAFVAGFLIGRILL
jgi:ElaB/YqjD/DUF883 family membrane-anchored ribosome-binding protein